MKHHPERNQRGGKGVGALAGVSGPVLLAVVLAACLAACQSCSREEIAVLELEEEIHGFRLGERRADFNRRVGGDIGLRRIPIPRGDPRERMYEAERTPDRAPEIERVRLAFQDDHLMEVILYQRVTSVARMHALKRQLERHYGARATSPDGTVETVFKTYRIKGPDMSITLRRITKHEGTELYIQYLHDELTERLRRRAEK